MLRREKFRDHDRSAQAIFVERRGTAAPGALLTTSVNDGRRTHHV
jgi:hypothetical protein